MTVPEEMLRQVRSSECRDPARCGKYGWRVCDPCESLAAELRAFRADNERLRAELLWSLLGWRAADIEQDQQRYNEACALASVAPGEDA